jgi:hypothetical protein
LPSIQRRYDIDWGGLGGRVVWQPAEHRQATVGEPTAMRILRCTPESFARLREHGLEATATADGPAYDASDIRNAALYSGSGRTEIETAMGAILSFLRDPDEDLFGKRGWTYQMIGRDTPDRCLLHPLTPDAFGGESGPLSAGGAAPVRVGERVMVPADVPLHADIVTRGRADPVRDPAIGTLTEEFLASGVRWHQLSPGLKRDPHAAFAHGVGDCDTLTAVLLKRFTDARYEARAYRGWIVGITDTPHSWIEVTDADQRTKVVDPSLLLLARHPTLGDPGFGGRVFGAALNRIAPTRCDLAEPIGVTVAGAPCRVKFFCRRAW